MARQQKQPTWSMH